MRTEKRVIAVIGSTGNQGGGLVQAMLERKECSFYPRALTRDPSKPAAKKLQNMGVEVIEFDLEDESTFTKALEGAYGLFVVTNWFELLDTTKEVEQVKRIAEYAADKVEHIVWSTMEDSRPFFDSLTDNKPPPVDEAHGYYISNTDGKGYANQYFPKDKTTFLYTSMYAENLFNFGLVQKGQFLANLGDSQLSLISAIDIGKCALGIFEKGTTEYAGQSVYAVGMKVTGGELMKACANATGKQFHYVPVSRNDFSTAPFPGAASVANYFEYHTRCSDAANDRSIAKTQELNPELITSVMKWAEHHKEDLMPLAGGAQ